MEEILLVMVLFVRWILCNMCSISDIVVIVLAKFSNKVAFRDGRTRDVSDLQTTMNKTEILNQHIWRQTIM